MSHHVAADLRDRITGWREDVFVAVLPAAAIRAGGGDDADEASALLDGLYDAMGRLDGIYVVNLSGAGTYAAGYGDASGAIDVGRVVAGQVRDHTLGQVDQVLDGTIDELGAPDGGGMSWGWVVVALQRTRRQDVAAINRCLGVSRAAYRDGAYAVWSPR